METKLFDYLKKKANDPTTRDKIIYTQTRYEESYISDIKSQINSNLSLKEFLDTFRVQTNFTYNDLYQMVLKKREFYKKQKYRNKTPYLIVFNQVKSIADIIALTSLGYSPILIGGHQLAKEKYDNLDDIIAQSTFCTKNGIISNYEAIPLSLDKLNQTINKSRDSIVINKPEAGRIGIFSSGSLGNPKTVYVSEEDIITNVHKSRYNNNYRAIYNTAPLSSISGLFTNLFLPLVNDDTEACLSNDFNIKSATFCTDVYLPRNYTDLLKDDDVMEGDKIQRIFIFGEINNNGLIKAIRSKLKLPENVFVHVYGCTECGGLVSEYEEKDFDELHVYAFNIENDLIIFSFDDINFYSLRSGKLSHLYKDEIQKYQNKNFLKSIPCGLLSEGNIKINNKTIGEGIIGESFYTGDIFVTVNDKLYILGRKNNLNKNHYIANFDSEISSIIDNRTCSSFTNETNSLCLAIKYHLDYNDGSIGEDHTQNFRRLIKQYERLNKRIRYKYPIIEEIIYLTDDKFPQSGGLKKTIRSGIEKLLDEGRKINYNLEHFEDVLKERINNSCQKRLGFIPKYSLDENKNIIFDGNEVNQEDLVKLLNDLSIVAIIPNGDNYHVFYDDTYFFDENKGRKYNELELLDLEVYAEKELLVEKLAADNKNYVRKLDDKCHEVLENFDNYVVYYKEYKDYNGSTILIPYYYCSLEKRRMNRENQEAFKEANNIINKYIKENFGGKHFTDSNKYLAFPSMLNGFGFLKTPIYIDQFGEATFDSEDSIYKKYFCHIFSKMYDVNTGRSFQTKKKIFRR